MSPIYVVIDTTVVASKRGAPFVAKETSFTLKKTCIISSLKVPKREIFVTELFILSDPIWVGDLRNEPKKTFV